MFDLWDVGEPYMDAFLYLNRRRQRTESGPQPLTAQEIGWYALNHGHPLEEFEAYMDALDAAWQDPGPDGTAAADAPPSR